MTESNPRCCSPAFLIKKDGTPRLIVDYRQLNKQLLADRFPFPYSGRCVPRPAFHSVFSKLDMSQGYHQISVSDDSCWLTCFVTPFGKYEYLRMLFGLSVVLRVFQRHITNLFFKEPEIKVFLDDILMTSSDIETYKKPWKETSESWAKIT